MLKALQGGQADNAIMTTAADFCFLNFRVLISTFQGEDFSFCPRNRSGRSDRQAHRDQSALHPRPGARRGITRTDQAMTSTAPWWMPVSSVASFIL